MHKENLLKMAAFLDKLKPALFDFRHILHVGENAPDKAFEVGGGCGTTACVVGWMPKVFPEQCAWHPSYDGDQEPDIVLKGSLFTNSRGRFEYKIQNFAAAREVFQINEDESMFLFDPGESSVVNVYGRSTPKELAEHIRRFIKCGGIYRLENDDFDRPVRYEPAYYEVA